jgi:hypothetical protein
MHTTIHSAAPTPASAGGESSHTWWASSSPASGGGKRCSSATTFPAAGLPQDTWRWRCQARVASAAGRARGLYSWRATRAGLPKLQAANRHSGQTTSNRSGKHSTELSKRKMPQLRPRQDLETRAPKQHRKNCWLHMNATCSPTPDRSATHKRDEVAAQRLESPGNVRPKRVLLHGHAERQAGDERRVQLRQQRRSHLHADPTGVLPAKGLRRGGRSVNLVDAEHAADDEQSRGEYEDRRRGTPGGGLRGEIFCMTETGTAWRNPIGGRNVGATPLRTARHRSP